MFVDETHGLGRVEVTTVPMPAFAKELSATYTFSGSVLVLFRRADDPGGGRAGACGRPRGDTP